MEHWYGVMVQFTSQNDARNCGNLVMDMFNPATLIEDTNLVDRTVRGPG